MAKGRGSDRARRHRVASAKARGAAKSKTRPGNTGKSGLTNPRQSPTTPPLPSGMRSRVMRWAGRFWKVVTGIGSVIGLVGAAWLYWPTVTVQAAAIIDEGNAANAEFTVTNSGRVHVYSIVFDCTVIDRNGVRYNSAGNVLIFPGRTIAQEIDDLAPGHSITRNCSWGGAGGPLPAFPMPYPAYFEIRTPYIWPLFGLISHASPSTFASRTDGNGHHTIVPDTE